MTNWQVLRFSGKGSFDHEADTRETALVLVLPRQEESIACSILRDAALFCKRTSLKAAISLSTKLAPWPRVLSVTERDLQNPTWCECSSLLTAWKRYPSTAASQPGEGGLSFV